MSINLKQCIWVLLLLACGYTASAQTVYVNRAATGTNTGASWANAYTSLSAAMRATKTVGQEIWVAGGTYTPDTTAGFFLSPGVQLYGGFVGTEANRSQRNPTTNATILSGDRQNNDTPGNFTANRTDNALHVIWLNGTDTVSRAIIDGFTIRNGNTAATNTTTPAVGRGGGVLAQTKVTIRNCLFTQNAGANGAAIATLGAGASGILVRDCRFEGNFTGERSIVYFATLRNGECRRNIFQGNSTARGSFMADGSRTIVLDSCVFTKNRTNGTNLCAGAYTLASTATITNCNFTDLRSLGSCGAMWLNGNNVANLPLIVRNCTFERDTASGFGGGAFYITSAASATITDCKVSNCIAASGGGATFVGFAAVATFRNCTFNKNSTASAGGASFTQNAGSVITYDNCTFTENKSGSGSSGFGGAIFCGFYGENSVTNCTFTKNESMNIGGAISMQNDTSKLTVTGCTFAENSAVSSGGAIYQNVGPDVIINTSTFSTNSSNFGAGISADGSAADKSTLTISRSKFFGNSATTQGGALNLEGSLVTSVSNTLFIQNLGGNGGAISNNGTGRDTTIATITYCTFAENLGDRPCLVQFEPKDSLRAQATMILQNNAFGPHDGNLYEIEEGTPTVNSLGGNVATDQSLKDYLKGTNDKNGVEPKFVNATQANYRPAVGSPAIDNAVPVATITVDIDGTARGNKPDAGAYEGSTVGAFSAVQALRLEMSPNPAPQQVRLQINDERSGTAIVEYFDALGKLVASNRTEKTAGEWQFTQSIAAWPAGLYQVRVRVGSTLYAGTLVKE